jgi:Fuc2NAc and GlcNAc transferase
VVIFLFTLVIFTAALVTGVIRAILVRRGVIDLPNLRSSHVVAVPRGGGVAIVVVFLSAVVWMLWNGSVPLRLGWAIVGGGLAIAIVGFLDDCFNLPQWPRLAIHCLAAAWAVWCLLSSPSPQINGGTLGPWVGCVVALFGLVWLTNLFNFMDGIDGLAAVETVCVSAFGAFLFLENGSPNLAQVSCLLSAATLGFLAWNWPPAKVFLGDAGSGFLGFSLGVLAIFASKAGAGLNWSWLILLAAFLVDATVTLLLRMISRSRWYQPHRSHAYQHAAQMWGSHAKVTLAFGAIDCIWLFPLAYAAFRYPRAAPIIAAIAVVPLLYLTFRFEGGRERPTSRGCSPRLN